MRLEVNGSWWEGEVEPRLSLADLLRDRLRLTGTHLGCEHGVCGACTVLLDGKAARSCLVLAAQAAGHRVETVESLAADRLSALQAAFLEDGAFQCGFCTPGFLMTAAAIYREGRRRTLAEIEELVSGNICRCTGYRPIVDAIHRCQP